MRRKSNTARNDTAQSRIINDRPTISGNTLLPALELPPDFDFTHHIKVLASRQIRPTTHEEFAEMIAKLEQQLGK